MAMASGEDFPDGWVCEFCNGTSGRPRASPGSRRCTSNKAPYKCRDALAAARQTEKEELAARKSGRAKRVREVLDELQLRPGYAAFISSKECFFIHEVLGVSSVNLEALTEGEQRGGVDPADYCPEYLVRGGFGDAGNEKDALMPGTRWVALLELMDNIPLGQLALLEAFDSALAKEMAAARRLVQEERAERAAAQQEAATGRDAGD